MDSNAKALTRAEIDDLVSLTQRFVRVTAAHQEIAKLLLPHGLTATVLNEGWTLAYKVGRIDRPDSPQALVDPTSAIEEIDAWDEAGFELAHIALYRAHVEQDEFLFANLHAVDGPDAVLGMKIFLDRLDELESSPARASTRVADQAALDALAARSLDKSERARLRALVTLAMTGNVMTMPTGQLGGAPKPEDIAALQAWYTDWTKVARLVIARRDLLFRLGVVKRRRQRKQEEAVTTTPVAPTAPVTTPTLPNGNGGSAVPA